MTDIKSLSPAEIKDLLAELSAPSFHAKQIFKWLHSGVSSFDEMTDLSKPLRRKVPSNIFGRLTTEIALKV